MRSLTLLLGLLATVAGAAAGEPGPYPGQTLPGLEPQIFAPGLVSTGLHERDLVVHPGGDTIWFGVIAGPLYTVMETRRQADGWSAPRQASFHRDRTFVCFEPALSADGQRVLFLSNRAAPGQEQGEGWANQNLFQCRRLPDGSWSEATALPAPVTSDAGEFFPSLAADGTLYFTREVGGASAVWSAEREGDGWAEPVRIEGAVNLTDAVYNTWCPPDEAWLLGCVGGHEDNLGPADYWISFADGQGGWLPAVNLGEPFNGPGLRAMSASLSPDGRCLFFSSRRQTVAAPAADQPLTQGDLLAAHGEPGGGSLDIWWVDAAVLDRWRPDAARGSRK
jgi:hypothetical protein